MKIRTANENDLKWLAAHDTHVSQEELKHLLSLQRVYVAEADGQRIGWLRYNLFWENTPFLNMLFLLAPQRGKGYGKALVQAWEDNMRAAGYSVVMTSTASDECAQHFYHKLCYQTVGGFLPNGGPLELILQKEL